jgi:hypothetical protein
MNIYLTENYEITNVVWAKAEHWWPRVIPYVWAKAEHWWPRLIPYVWAKAEHWWPRVIPYKLHYFFSFANLQHIYATKQKQRKISINEFGCGQFPIIYNIGESCWAIIDHIQVHLRSPICHAVKAKRLILGQKHWVSAWELNTLLRIHVQAWNINFAPYVQGKPVRL